MPVDESLVGRSFPPTGPYEVTEEAVTAFAESLGTVPEPIPPTFPIVLAFRAMNEFLAVERVELHRIVHGEQRFSYARPLRLGDRLTATLTVTGLRQLGGADVIATSSEIVDADGAVVCTGRATLVHGGGQ
jgi:acyl dehydratase